MNLNEEALGTVARLANALVSAEQATKEADEALKAAKERERALREDDLPSAMQELGLEKIKLNSGETVEVKSEVYASIPAAEKANAFQWLESNGFGGLIKTEVEVAFGRDERDAAMELAARLEAELLRPVVASSSVHAQTLKAFLKEQLAKGASIPMELFGARSVFTAKVKR